MSGKAIRFVLEELVRAESGNIQAQEFERDLNDLVRRAQKKRTTRRRVDRLSVHAENAHLVRCTARVAQALRSSSNDEDLDETISSLLEREGLDPLKIPEPITWEVVRGSSLGGHGPTHTACAIVALASGDEISESTLRKLAPWGWDEAMWKEFHLVFSPQPEETSLSYVVQALQIDPGEVPSAIEKGNRWREGRTFVSGVLRDRPKMREPRGISKGTFEVPIRSLTYGPDGQSEVDTTCRLEVFVDGDHTFWKPVDKED